MSDDLPRAAGYGYGDPGTRRRGTRHWVEYAALSVACPVCEAPAEHDCHNATMRHAPHWARIATATVHAAEEARHA